MKSEFKIQITTGSMYHFLMYSMYHGFGGIFSVILSAVLIGYYVLNRTEVVNSWMYLLFGILFLVYEPWTLYTRAAKQAKLNPVFKAPLSYEVSENGIKVMQNDQVNEVAWESVMKVRETGQSLLVYTGKKYAFIWVKKQMKEEEMAVRELLKEYVPAARRKMKG